MSDEQMTRSEWERERAAELAQKNQVDLAAKVAGLEYDLKTVRTERDDLKGRVPEGSVVLSKADAERWTSYQQLGKPDELKTRLDKGGEDAQRLAQAERRDHIRSAAEAEGFKPGPLERLLPADATFETREIEVDGKKRQAGYIKFADGKERPLTEYAESELADYLPALRASEKTVTTPTVPGVRQTVTTPPTTPLTEADRISKMRATTDISF